MFALGILLTTAGIALSHVSYLHLLRIMKDMGLEAPYGGNSLSIGPNLRRYKAHCRANNIPFDHWFWVRKVGLVIGYGGIALVYWSVRRG
jgi:hypothetical protein